MPATIDFFRAFVEQHLTRVWVHPECRAWAGDKNADAVPVRQAWADENLSQPVDLHALDAAIEIGSGEVDVPPVRVVAGINPELGAGSFVLTEQRDVVAVFQTESSRRADGVVQLYGSPGLVIVRPETFRAYSGGTFVEGTTTVKTLRLLKRDNGGKWCGASASVTLSRATPTPEP